MAIAVRASGSAVKDIAGTNTSQTISKPAGSATGDLMIMVVSFGWGSGTCTIDTPVGWTAIGSNIGGTGSNSEVTSAFYRQVVAGDTSWTVVRDAASTGLPAWAIVLQTFTGHDTTTPIDATGTTATNTGSATLSAPAVTVVTDQAWHTIAAGTWNNAAMSATSFTALNNGSPSTNEQCALLYNTTPKSTGSTGAVTVNGGTASGNTMSVIPFAIRPAATGGGASALVIPPFPSIPPAFLTY